VECCTVPGFDDILSEVQTAAVSRVEAFCCDNFVVNTSVGKLLGQQWIQLQQKFPDGRSGRHVLDSVLQAFMSPG
jgi:hypothetical protein